MDDIARAQHATVRPVLRLRFDAGLQLFEGEQALQLSSTAASMPTMVVTAQQAGRIRRGRLRWMWAEGTPRTAREMRKWTRSHCSSGARGHPRGSTQAAMPDLFPCAMQGAGVQLVCVRLSGLRAGLAPEQAHDPEGSGGARPERYPSNVGLWRVPMRCSARHMSQRTQLRLETGRQAAYCSATARSALSEMETYATPLTRSMTSTPVPSKTWSSTASSPDRSTIRGYPRSLISSTSSGRRSAARFGHFIGYRTIVSSFVAPRDSCALCVENQLFGKTASGVPWASECSTTLTCTPARWHVCR